MVAGGVVDVVGGFEGGFVLLGFEGGLLLGFDGGFVVGVLVVPDSAALQVAVNVTLEPGIVKLAPGW